jgi:hypothetical protein
MGGASRNGKIGELDFPPWQQANVVLDFAIWSGSFMCILLKQNFLVAFVSLEQMTRGQFVLDKGLELGRLALLVVTVALLRIVVAVILTKAGVDKDGARLLGAVLLCRQWTLVTRLGHCHLLGWANLVHNVFEVEQAMVDQLLSEAAI